MTSIKDKHEVWQDYHTEGDEEHTGSEVPTVFVVYVPLVSRNQEHHVKETSMQNDLLGDEQTGTFHVHFYRRENVMDERLKPLATQLALDNEATSDKKEEALCKGCIEVWSTQPFAVTTDQYRDGYDHETELYHQHDIHNEPTTMMVRYNGLAVTQGDGVRGDPDEAKEEFSIVDNFATAIRAEPWKYSKYEETCRRSVITYVDGSFLQGSQGNFGRLATFSPNLFTESNNKNLRYVRQQSVTKQEACAGRYKAISVLLKGKDSTKPVDGFILYDWQTKARADRFRSMFYYSPEEVTEPTQSGALTEEQRMKIFVDERGCSGFPILFSSKPKNVEGTMLLSNLPTEQIFIDQKFSVKSILVGEEGCKLEATRFSDNMDRVLATFWSTWHLCKPDTFNPAMNIGGVRLGDKVEDIDAEVGRLINEGKVYLGDAMNAHRMQRNHDKRRSSDIPYSTFSFGRKDMLSKHEHFGLGDSNAYMKNYEDKHPNEIEEWLKRYEQDRREKVPFNTETFSFDNVFPKTDAALIEELNSAKEKEERAAEAAKDEEMEDVESQRVETEAPTTPTADVGGSMTVDKDTARGETTTPQGDTPSVSSFMTPISKNDERSKVKKRKALESDLRPSQAMDLTCEDGVTIIKYEVTCYGIEAESIDEFDSGDDEKTVKERERRVATLVNQQGAQLIMMEQLATGMALRQAKLKDSLKKIVDKKRKTQ
jgi:hypothetical protein